jgi:hypothetical protein
VDGFAEDRNQGILMGKKSDLNWGQVWILIANRCDIKVARGDVIFPYFTNSFGIIRSKGEKTLAI